MGIYQQLRLDYTVAYNVLFLGQSRFLDSWKGATVQLSRYLVDVVNPDDTLARLSDESDLDFLAVVVRSQQCVVIPG